MQSLFGPITSDCVYVCGCVRVRGCGKWWQNYYFIDCRCERVILVSVLGTPCRMLKIVNPRIMQMPYNIVRYFGGKISLALQMSNLILKRAPKTTICFLRRSICAKWLGFLLKWSKLNHHCCWNVQCAKFNYTSYYQLRLINFWQSIWPFYMLFIHIFFLVFALFLFSSDSFTFVCEFCWSHLKLSYETSILFVSAHSNISLNHNDRNQF